MSNQSKKRTRSSSSLSSTTPSTHHQNETNNKKQKLQTQTTTKQQLSENATTTKSQQQQAKKRNPFDILENSLFVRRIVPQNQQKKVNQTIQHHMKKRNASKQQAQSDSDDSSSDSDDDEFDWVQNSLSKFPIVFANRLSDNSSDAPFLRYLFYKKHFGALKHNDQQFTSLFNQKLLMEGENGAKSETTEEQEDEQLKKLIEKRSKDQTLFLTNVPYNETPQSITQFFEKAFDAKLNKCIFSDLEKQHQQALEKGEETVVLNNSVDSPFSDCKTNHFLSSGTVHVILNEANKMNETLIAPELFAVDGETESNNNKRRPLFAFEKSDSACTGLERYANEHRGNQVTKDRVETVKSSINQWMMNFDQTEKNEEELIEALRGQTDKDGWTKVIAPKGKRHLPPPQKEDILQKNASAKRPSKFKDQVEMPFYKYQRAESKKKEIELLRQKFEQDKQLIEQMKNNKQFKPY